MARITEHEARRLGLPPAKAKAAASAKPRGRSRAERKSHDGAAVEFVVRLDGDPRPKERPRTVVDMDILRTAFLSSRGSLKNFLDSVSGKLSRTFTPKGTSDYEKTVAQAAAVAMLGRKPFSCPVETVISFVLKGDPGSWPTSRRDGDADNLEKAVLDALNGIVFEDDSLVVRSFREKTCGENPSVSICVRPARP